MILEGIITTDNTDGSANISPMGPAVEDDMRQLILRPYPTSRTFANLKRTRAGVFHITDDVELLARAAIGNVDPLPEMSRAPGDESFIITGACRWYAFKISDIDESQERMRVTADVVESGRFRDFLGFNRGKHAVVEAAILATRTAFIPAVEIFANFDKLRAWVEKTGGPQEHRAFALLEKHIRNVISKIEASAHG